MQIRNVDFKFFARKTTAYSKLLYCRKRKKIELKHKVITSAYSGKPILILKKCYEIKHCKYIFIVGI